MKTHEWLRTIEEIVDEGCLSVLLTGGEPLVREDISTIYMHAKKKGLILKLFTNGTRVTPAFADLLAEWPPHSVEITLYGRSERVYEQVTGVKGSYRQCMRGIELLLDRGIHVMLKTVVLQTNKHELWDMKDFSKQLGLSFRFDPLLNHRLNGDATPGKLRIDPEEAAYLDVLDGERLSAWKNYAKLFSGSRPRGENLYDCGAGLTSFHVDAYGRLSACIMSREPCWDIRTRGFRFGWREFIPTVIQQKRQQPSPCQSCRIGYLCEQCPGWGQLEHGDPGARVDFLCRIAHARADNIRNNCEGVPGDQLCYLISPTRRKSTSNPL